jgi:hypothetical protein
MLFQVIKPFKDSEWILKHCFNKLFDSERTIIKIQRFLEEGETGGELDWSIQKWSLDVEHFFEVPEYEGYMAYVGAEEHGQDEEEHMSFHTEETVNTYLIKGLEWYLLAHPELTTQIEVIRKKLKS